MKNVTKNYSFEFALDLPIFIDGLTLYPFKMKDLMTYFSSIKILKLEKAQINIKYIKMSYYTFLCEYIGSLAHSDKEEEQLAGNSYMVLFASLFSGAMRTTILPSFSYNPETKESCIKLYEIDTEKAGEDIYKSAKKEYTLTKEKFDDIRSILIYQNDVHFIDYDNYSRDMQKLIKDEEARRARKSGGLSIEDKTDSVITACGFTSQEIGEMTIRRFERVYERMRKKIEYQINKTGAMSGLVTFKDKSILEPWTNPLDSDPLKNIITDYDSFVKGTRGMMGKV